MLCTFAIAMLVVGVGCGGGDGDVSDFVPVDADAVERDDAMSDDGETSDDESASDADDSDTAAGFGDLMEGSFVLSGAVDERFEFDDDQLAFQTVGGCEGGMFGVGVHVRDAAETTTFAMFSAQTEVDMSGGVTGEFDDVDFEATVFENGDVSLPTSIEGPVTMAISEHDTGGADADLNARRMTVSLSGTIPSDEGDVDLDIDYRWVMGCP